MRRAVRFGDAYAPYSVSPSQVAKRRIRLAALASAAGRSPDGVGLACLVTLIPAHSTAAAIQRGIAALALSGLSPDTLRAHYLLGADDALLERVAEYRNVGVDHLILGCIPGTDAELDEFFAKATLIRSQQ